MRRSLLYKKNVPDEEWNSFDSKSKQNEKVALLVRLLLAWLKIIGLFMRIFEGIIF